MRNRFSEVVNRNLGKLPATVLCLVLTFALVWAGETGKVVGRVTDQSTGQPVAGAVVEVEGSELGANTEEDGRYVILNVPAGTWTITASATGYSSSTLTGVLVIADQTATANFKLGSKVYNLPEQVTTAERPMVIRSAVQTTRVVTNQEFTRLPVSGLSQLVGLQAGVTQTSRGGWTHIRGGRYNDVSFLVDGVSAKDALVGTLWSSPRPTAENIEAVEVISGSFDAEYGEAMSGVIQTTTKEGGPRTSGKLKYTTDEMFPGKDLNFGYNLVQATIGGPLFTRPLRYFVSAEYYRTRDDANALFQVQAPRNEYTIEGKVNYSLKGLFINQDSKKDNLKLIIDGHHSNYEWQGFSQACKYHLEQMYANRVRSYKANLRANYLPNPATLVELAAGTFSTKLVRSPRLREAEKADTTGFSGFLRKAGLWNRFIFKCEDWVFNNPENLPLDSAVLQMYRAYRVVGNDTIKDEWPVADVGDANPWGVPGFFYQAGGNNSYFHTRATADKYVKGAMTLTPNKIHEIKTGFELTFYDLADYTNQLPYDQFPFFEAFRKQPTVAAAYVQDKADFENLVVRAGVRFDLLDVNDSVRLYAESIGGSARVRDLKVAAGIKWRISPRLGLSYPITDRIKFRFSYGHFYRNPDFDNIYSSLLSAEEIMRRANAIIGNPNMTAEKTIGYEMGFDAQVSDFFQFDFTAFYKDVFNLAGIRLVPAIPAYTMYTNSAYARIKGFEATMAKALHDYWSARLGYTFSIARGTASTAYDQYNTTNPVQVDYDLDQDQRHAINGDIGLSFDQNFPFAPLRQFNASLIGRFASGLPYTPTNIRGERIGLQNSGRLPSSFTLDSRLGKNFAIGKINLSLTCDIYNLLNAKVVTAVYSATGKPDFDGRIITPNDLSWPAPRIGDAGAYHPARDYNHDGYVTRQEWYDSYMAARTERYYRTPMNYGASRKIRFGASIGF